MSGRGPRSAPWASHLFTDAVVHELWGDGDEEALHRAEAEVVARAVVGRRRQFAAGRQCARASLAVLLGTAPGPVLAGERRQPRWPPGVAGTIAHTDGYAVAATRLDRGDGIRIGVDAERVGRVTPELFGRLFTESEREWLADLQPARRAVVVTALFGMKEAFYKAQFPLTGAWVGFHDVEIDAAGAVEGSPAALRPATTLAALDAFTWPVSGRFRAESGIVVAAVEAVPR